MTTELQLVEGIAAPYSVQQPFRNRFDLLSHGDLLFSQRRLLTVRDIEREFERRDLQFGLGFTEAHLEALHRTGVLTPLYRLDKRHFFTNQIGELRAAQAAGQLFDPQMERGRNWSVYKRRDGSYRQWTSEFLYSPYQLLLVPEIRSLIPFMKRRGNLPLGEAMEKGRLRYDLDLNQFSRESSQWAARINDNQVIALSAIEAKYLPRIIGIFRFSATSDEAELFRARESFDPVSMLGWLGWTADQVLQTAEALLIQADQVDPLREWRDLVRLTLPTKWDKLRGDTLVAVERRIAAEMLLLFYEDLVRAQAAPPLPVIPDRQPHPLRSRLRPDWGELDAVLMEFALSPHPSLVLMIEGETEEYVVPLAMDLLQIPRFRNFIEVINRKGVDRNIDVFAAYSTLPELGDELGDGILLNRPLTRFLLVADAESSFRSPTTREDVRRRLVKEIYDRLPSRYRTPAFRKHIDQSVIIDTWSDGSFEFAHFSDDELADAIVQAYGPPAPISKSQLIAAIAQQRARKGNIEKVYQSWTKPHPNKTKIAEILWPVLEARMGDLLGDDRLDDIPLARVLRCARRLAQELPRRDLMLQL